jgi:hypothetical protein
VVETAARGASAGAAAHHEAAHRRVVLDAGRRVLEPAIEPAKSLGVVDRVSPRGLRPELDLADGRGARAHAAVVPRTDHEPLRRAAAPCHLGELPRDLGDEAVVPPCRKHGRQVGIAIEPALLVENLLRPPVVDAVEILVAHQHRFEIRHRGEGSRARAVGRAK